MTDQIASSEHGEQAHNQLLTVHVVAPNSPHKKTFHWVRIMKVGDAAREAATAFGYQGGTPAFQTDSNPPRQLDNQKTLVAEHVKSGDTLEIVDIGGGV